MKKCKWTGLWPKIPSKSQLETTAKKLFWGSRILPWVVNDDGGRNFQKFVPHLPYRHVTELYLENQNLILNLLQGPTLLGWRGKCWFLHSQITEKCISQSPERFYQPYLNHLAFTSFLNESQERKSWKIFSEKPEKPLTCPYILEENRMVWEALGGTAQYGGNCRPAKTFFKCCTCTYI